MKAIIITLLLLPFSLLSQSSLQGKITDSKSNEPILFGTVALMKDGAVVKGVESDLDGNYYFSDIASGTYDVEASYVGYTSTRISSFILRKNISNSLNIKLNVGYLDFTTCSCTCYKVPLLEFDNTLSGFTFTSDDIKNLPIPK